MPDQLDTQSHVEVAAIRRSFVDARRRAATWEPAPLSHPSRRVVTGGPVRDRGGFPAYRTPYLDEVARPQPWLR